MVPIRGTIRRMNPYQMEEDRAPFVRLDANENPYGPSPQVAAALAAVAPADLARYPDRKPLRDAIAAREGLTADETELSNGSDDLLRNLIDLAVAPGDTAVVTAPTFSMNILFLMVREACIVKVPFGPADTFPEEGIIAAAREAKAKLLLLVNPGAPIGALIAPAAIERVIAALPDTLVVVDEAYGEFAGVTVAPLVRRYPNLVVTRTFSKAWGLAGMRVGYCFADPGIIGPLRTALSPYPLSAATIAAAIAALSDEGWMRRCVAKICAERERMGSLLAALGYTVYPSAANSLTVAGERLAAAAAYLKERGILVRHFAKLPPLPADALRISVGRPEDTDRLITALKEWRRT